MPNSCPAPIERLYGVLGYPLAQSLSPVLHTWAFAQRGIPAAYTAWETPPEHVPAFMQTFRETPFSGASVTIPHKVAVMEYLDGMTDAARSVGAVNTLYWEGPELIGHNTDMQGFLAPLADMPRPEAALVLGAGGAARAVLAALLSLNTPLVHIAARDTAKAEALAAAFANAVTAITPLAWGEREKPLASANGLWVINTTPLGMAGKGEGTSPLPAPAFFAAAEPGACLAYDLVYNPPCTPFLAAAKTAGWQCRDGLAMFLAQANAQFALWTGREMPSPVQARALVTNCLV